MSRAEGHGDHAAASWHLRFGSQRISLGRSGTLLIARIWEQAVLGLANLLFAWKLGVEGFAPVSILLIVNSLSVLASDLGLGTDITRRPIRSVGTAPLRRVRTIALIVFLTGLGSAMATDGDWRTILFASGVVWGLSAEAFIRKSALIRLDRVRRAAGVEIAGSTVLGIAIAVGIADPTHALAILAGGMIAKHLVELLSAKGWNEVVGDDPRSTWDVYIWLSGLLTYGIANVDFLIVGVIVSAEAFSVYSLGFRVAAVFVAQISYVIARVAVVDFGRADTKEALQRAHTRRSRQLLYAGIATAVTTAGIAPLLPILLGTEWTPAVGVVIALAAIIPWRMCLGTDGMLVISQGEARQLSRWEAVRLVALTGFLLAGALFGFQWFVAAVVVGAVVSGVAYSKFGPRVAGITPYRPITLLAPFGLVLALVACASIPAMP